MGNSTVEIEVPGATSLKVTEEALTAYLADGRIISAPLAWYPRLVHATQEERDNWELFGDGLHMHWPDLDEDLSIQGMLGGWPSRESPRSLKRWLEAKREGRGLTIPELNAYEEQRRQREANVR